MRHWRNPAKNYGRVIGATVDLVRHLNIDRNRQRRAIFKKLKYGLKAITRQPLYDTQMSDTNFTVLQHKKVNTF